MFQFWIPWLKCLLWFFSMIDRSEMTYNLDWYDFYFCRRLSDKAFNYSLPLARWLQPGERLRCKTSSNVTFHYTSEVSIVLFSNFHSHKDCFLLKKVYFKNIQLYFYFGSIVQVCHNVLITERFSTTSITFTTVAAHCTYLLQTCVSDNTFHINREKYWQSIRVKKRHYYCSLRSLENVFYFYARTIIILLNLSFALSTTTKTSFSQKCFTIW